jgi:hypothetical protein
MSTMVAAGRFDRFSPYRAVGAIGLDVELTWADPELELRYSASNWLPNVNAALDLIKDKYNVPGWDGEGSRAVNGKTIDTTKAIITAIFENMPPGIPPPDIGPEPDGEIAVDWMLDAKRMFSFSVGDHEKINFAGRFANGQSRHGCLEIDTTTRLDLSLTVRELSQYIIKLHKKDALQRAA